MAELISETLCISDIPHTTQYSYDEQEICFEENSGLCTSPILFTQFL
jgi:hypothetical protein